MTPVANVLAQLKPALRLKLAALMLLTITALTASSSHAAIYEMDFPVRLNGVEVGQIVAAVDGIKLDAVGASSLANNLAKVFSKDVNLWLAQQGDQAIDIAQLRAQGISLTLLAQDLIIELQLSESAMATDRLTYTQAKHVVLPNRDARWAVLSNFNFNHQRNNNNQDHSAQFEWLLDGNIGGGDGINLKGAGFWDHNSNTGGQFYRSDFRLFYDQPQKPLRYSLGDTQSRVSGHLNSYPLGGLSINKAYAQLQPQRNLSPGNSQVFVLPRHATLEIFVNDFMLSRIRLPPGRYDVNDLPLTSGSNNIRIIATFANGESQQFDFTTHYNAQLLTSGLSDYSLAIGYPSAINRNTYHYEDHLMISGMFDYGVTDTLTLGVNGVSHDDGTVAGLRATMGYPWGNLSLRYSASQWDHQFGQAYAIDSEHSVFGQSRYGSANLRLGYERKQRFSATPWLITANLADNDNRYGTNNDRVYFDYSFFVNDNIDINAFGSLSTDFDQPQIKRSKEFTSQVNWRDQGLNISMGYRYGSINEATTTQENSVFFNLTWSLYHRQNNTRERLRYNSQTKIATATHTKVNNNRLNDYGYELLAEKGQADRREQLKASYTSRLLRTDMTANNLTRTAQPARSNVSINLSTSVGIVQGHVGVGTNITTPFALVTKHKTLKDYDVLVNVDRNKHPQTKTGDTMGALLNVGSGYTTAQFSVDVPDAPFGYDWGPGTYQLTGGASTGHYFEIGSALSYTLIGTLVNEQGAAVSLQRGHIQRLQSTNTIAHQELNEAPNTQPFKQSIFTNRSGRFVIEGIGSGEFIVEIQGATALLVIDEAEQRFINVGQITLTKPPATPQATPQANQGEHH